MKNIAYLICIALCGPALVAQTELAEIDRNIEALRKTYGLPGAAVAVAYRGRLVYSRGFGVEQDTLFRVASVSKPFTAAALLKLQEAGKVRLDDRVFDVLTEWKPLLGDSRMASITLRQLLQHTGGWDSAASGDPMFPEHADLLAAGASFPPSLDEITGVWLGRRLDFAPGSRYAYSNFGYALAGKVIERASGMAYGEAVRALVLEPAGITHMRLARTLASAPGEARYSSLSATQPVLSVFSKAPVQVPTAYGGYAIENMGAHGGWLASAPDLLRMITALDGSRTPLLTAESYRQLIAKPAGLSSGSTWYGLGMQVIPSASDYVLTHDGALSDTCFALVARGVDGTAFAFVTNAMFSDAQSNRLDELELAVLQAIAGVTSQVRTWPSGDLFGMAGPSPRVHTAVNAASFQVGPVAPGEIVSLFGAGLGATVWFDDTAAPVLYAGDGQVNAVAPFNLAGKKQVAVTVSRDGVWSAPSMLAVAKAAPGIFHAAGTALAINQDGSINGAAAPAARGSILQLFATGLGAFQTEVPDGGLGSGAEKLAQTVAVSIGGVTARVVYAGTAPGLINGLAQVNVEVPGTVAAGLQPVVITAGGIASPDGVTVAVR